MNPSPILLTEKTYLAKGKRGIAYTAKLDGRTVLVKERNPKADVDTIAHEARMLQLLNKHGIGPLFIALQDDALIREFIDGEEVEDWIPHSSPSAIKNALLDVLHQCRSMDLLGIDKLEMTHPQKHILLRDNKPIMIDFDRSRETKKPKNVTQACSWLSSGRMRQLLEPKGISIDREATLAHAKSYKQTYDAQSFERICEMIRYG
jgi:putative serine/threonine protein kinase